MSYKSFMEETLRLNILLILNDIPQGKATDSLIENLTYSLYGHDKNMPRLRQNLNWLNERGLVIVDILSSDCFKATLTKLGTRVATGVETFPNIARPERIG